MDRKSNRRTTVNARHLNRYLDVIFQYILLIAIHSTGIFGLYLKNVRKLYGFLIALTRNKVFTYDNGQFWRVDFCKIFNFEIRVAQNVDIH